MMSKCEIGSLGRLSLTKAVINEDVKKQEPKQEAQRLEEKDTTTSPLYHLSCKITTYNHNPLTNIKIFLNANNIKCTISDAMNEVWPYGTVIITSTGFHGEFYKKDDDFMSLMYLGKTREEAINLMYRLVNQNIALDFKNK